MRRTRFAVKAVATALSAALILLSPGVDAYRAFAGGVVAGQGQAPAASAAWFVPLAGAFQREASAAPATLTGPALEFRSLVSGLSGLDAGSPASQRTLEPVAARLAQLGMTPQAFAGLPEAERGTLALEALRSASAGLTEETEALALLSAEGAQTPDLEGAASRLELLAGPWSLYLPPSARERASLARQAVRERIETQRRERTSERVRRIAAALNPKSLPIDLGDAAGVRAGSEYLSKPVPASTGLGERAAAQGVIPSPAADARPRRSLREALAHPTARALAIAVPAAALAGLALAVPGFLPAAAVAAGFAASALLHETAHLAAARYLGDASVPSLNPLRQVDPYGTVALPAVLAAVTSQFLPVLLVAGWAKPVDVQGVGFKDPARDHAKVLAAGPLANLALAAALGGALWGLTATGLIAPAGAAAFVLSKLALINAGLGAFNLLPHPGLDGGRLIAGLRGRGRGVPPAYREVLARLHGHADGQPHERRPAALRSEGGVLAAAPLAASGRRVMGPMAVAAVSVAAVGLAAAYGFAAALLGAPIVLVALVCSYDYYCIREKIQDEAAVNELIGLLEGFSTEIAQAAEESEIIRSEVNPEEVEHVLKNALEDMIDRAVDFEGFAELSNQEKWDRFASLYKEEAVRALKLKGMSDDDPEAIRELLEGERGKRFLSNIRAWVERHDVWRRWRSPSRKAGLRDNVKKKPGEKTSGSSPLASGVTGSARPRTFLEALDDPGLRLSAKEKGFLSLVLEEMKLKKKPPVIGRVEEMKELVKTISSPRGVINSVVLVGKAGVGKTAVAEKLAQALALSDAQAEDGTFRLRKLSDRYLLKLNLTRLLQQDSPAASLDALFQILNRFNDPDPRKGNKVILFIDEVHQLFDHPQGTMMANLLKEPLRDGEMTLVTATTEPEYRKYMEADEAFRRRLILIRVEEATVPETLRSLQGAKAFYEDLFQVEITAEALKAAAESSKYDQEVFLPGRAFKYVMLAAADADFDSRRDRLNLAIWDKIADLDYVMGRLSREMAARDLITEGVKKDDPTTIDLYNQAIDLSREIAGLYAKRAAVPASGNPVLTEDLVKEEISRKTGVASGQLSLGREPMEKYLEMEARLGERVIGQPEALEAIARAVRDSKAGLSDPKRPLGVFYLTGPTGTGKTHLAKELARFLFEDPEAVVRIDMSEYQHDHEVSKLMGSPPGYVGYDQGGQLTEAVRKRPYSVVLFDEIEKAHPAVWDIMLQIIGDGRLTDGKGRTVDFKNTLILMTSNLGMHAVDFGPFEAEYGKIRARLQENRNGLRALEAEAKEPGADAQTLALRRSALAEVQRLIEADRKALVERLSRETRARTLEVTEQAFKETYKPEFRGRLHAEPIVFNRITPEMAGRIVELNLKDLAGVLAFAGHEIEWTPEVRDHLAEEGFSIALGARPLQIAIQRLVAQGIATEILKAAVAEGGKVRPSRIRVFMADGGIRLDVSPLPPKPALKKDPGEGAARELFTRVFESVLKAAAKQALPDSAGTVIDGWMKLILAPAVPAESGTPAAASPETPSAAASGPASGMRFGVNEPLELGEAAANVLADHYRTEGKDSQVNRARDGVAAALEASGFPADVKDALLRSIPGAGHSHVGWLKAFVEQAKKMTPEQDRATPVEVLYEASGDAMRLLVHRNHEMSVKEQALLRDHFTGPVPLTSEAAREKAEALNVMGKDGRRLFYELYRVLAVLPGARMGWSHGERARGGRGTDYWIEVPRPPAPPPAADSSSAEAPAPPETPAQPVREPVVPPGEAGPADASDRKIVAREAERGPGDPRELWVQFGSNVSLKMARRMLTQHGLEPGSHVYPDGGFQVRVLARNAGHALRKARELARESWVSKVEAHPDLLDRLRGGARRAERSEPEDVRPGAPRATLRKVVVPEQHPEGAGDPGEILVQFREGMRLEAVDAILERHGLQRGRYWDAGGGYNVMTQAAGSGEAALKAEALSHERRVTSIEVHPDVQRIIRSWGTPAGEGGSEASRPAPGPESPKLTVDRGLSPMPADLIVYFHPDTIPGDVEEILELRSLERVSSEPDSLGRIGVRVRAGNRDLAAEAAAALAAEDAVAEVAVNPAMAEQLGIDREASPAPEADPSDREVDPAPSAGPALPSSQDPVQAVRTFALALLRQGDRRGPTLRMAAAETLAAVSTPDDLALARDWIRFEDMDRHFPEVIAAALILAKHGGGSDDQAAVVRAAAYLSRDQYAHLLNPAKARVAEALGRMVGTGTDKGLRKLRRRYKEEKLKPEEFGTADESRFSRNRNAVLLDALYEALARAGDADDRDLLVEDWTARRIPALYAYLQRSDPAFLARLVADWRAGEDAPDGAQRLLLLEALSDLGGAQEAAVDAERLLEIVTSGWSNQLDNETLPRAAEAFGRMLARLGLNERFKERLRGWLGDDLSGDYTFGKTMAAVMAVSEAGDEDDLALLEAMLRRDPEDINYVHEMTQHEAARAWARIVVRKGLLGRYLEAQPPAREGGRPLSKIQAMLADVNAVVNLAALETLKLALDRPGRAAPAPSALGGATPEPPLAAAPGHPFLVSGGSAVESVEEHSSWYEPLDRLRSNEETKLGLLPQAQFELAKRWIERFGRLVEDAFAVPNSAELRTARLDDGRKVAVFVLRESVTESSRPARVARLRELVKRLLHSLDLTPAARRERLHSLREVRTGEATGIEKLASLLRELSAVPGARMGIDHAPSRRYEFNRGELEVWLELTLAAEPTPRIR